MSKKRLRKAAEPGLSGAGAFSRDGYRVCCGGWGRDCGTKLEESWGCRKRVVKGWSDQGLLVVGY